MFAGLGSKKSIFSRKSILGDFIPNAIANGAWDSTWTEGCTYNSYTPTAVLQITGINQSISFKIGVSVTEGNAAVYYKKSSSSFSRIGIAGLDTSAFQTSHGYSYIAHNGTISGINNNDYLAFAQYETAYSTQVIVYNASNADSTFTTFEIYKDGECIPGCFLTTAVVGHMQLADDGPELTAMRLLRDLYRRYSPQHRDLIDEYYAVSPLLVAQINATPYKEQIYAQIYATVKTCQQFVEANNFRAAHDAYLAMYFNLKNRFGLWQNRRNTPGGTMSFSEIENEQNDH